MMTLIKEGIVLLAVLLVGTMAMPPFFQVIGGGGSCTGCRPSYSSPVKLQQQDLCYPNPCGINAQCRAGYDRSGRDRPVCSCFPGYIGDSLVQCYRPPIALPVGSGVGYGCRSGNCRQVSSCPTGNCI